VPGLPVGFHLLGLVQHLEAIKVEDLHQEDRSCARKDDFDGCGGVAAPPLHRVLPPELHHGNHEDDAYAGIQGDEEVTDKQRFVVTSPLTYLLVH